MVVQEVSLMCNRNALCWLTRYGKCHLETLIYLKFLGTYELWTSKRVWVIGYWRVWVMLIKCLQTNMGVQEMYGSLKSMADQGYGLLERRLYCKISTNSNFLWFFPQVNHQLTSLWLTFSWLCLIWSCALKKYQQSQFFCDFFAESSLTLID